MSPCHLLDDSTFPMRLHCYFILFYFFNVILLISVFLPVGTAVAEGHCGIGT